MSKSLSTFNAKLAEIARDYELLHEQCLSLQGEVSSLKWFDGHKVKASIPRMSAQMPIVSVLLAETPRMPDEHEGYRHEGSKLTLPPVPAEVGPRLLVTPRLRCHSTGVASTCGNLRPRQNCHVKEARKFEEVDIQWEALLITNKTASGECKEAHSPKSSPETVDQRTSRPQSTHRCSISSIRMSHWAYLSKKLLSGGRAWKLDPMWRTNSGMSFAISERTDPKSQESGMGSTVMQAFARSRRATVKGANKHSWSRRKLHPLIPPFHPDSTGKQIWDLFSILWLFLDLIVVPLAFFDSEVLEPSDEIKLLKAIFWTVDILMSCVTGYHRQDGFLEMRPSRIVQNYFKTHFLLDGTIVGTDWLLLLLEARSSLTGMSRVLIRSLRALRLLRFRKGLKRTSIIADNVVSEYIIVKLNILKVLFYVTLASHYIACFWYGLTRLEISDTSATWAQVNLEDEGRSSVFYAYSTSLHWALTQFTPASMEVVPESTAERLFTCMVILVAMVVFSSFVSSIQQAMNHIRQLGHQKRLQECAIRTFFQQRNIAHDTCVKIWRFIKRHKLTNVSLVRESDLEVLQQLPSDLKRELRQKLYEPILTQHPLLFVLQSRDADFIRILCNSCLREVQIGVGAEASPPGAEINDMTFVIRGMLEFLPSDKSETIYMKANDWMCELSLWANGVYLQGECYGDNKGAELVLLNSTRFRRSARKHSAHFNLLAAYAIRFVSLFSKLSENPRDAESVRLSTHRISDRLISSIMLHSDSMLFNNFDLITLIVEDATEGNLAFSLEIEELKGMRRAHDGEPSFLQRVGQSLMSWV